MKIKVNEASGPALDWMVAKCEGGYDLQLRSTYGAEKAWQYTMRDEEDPERMDKFYLADTSFSTDWVLAGPIIEREKISIRQWTNVPLINAYMLAVDAIWSSDVKSVLIAVMRCYVTSKLGDTVEVPDELTNKNRAR